MPYDDGRNGARARSARIRTSHDDEGTQLEEMRLRSLALEARPARASLLRRMATTFARMSRQRADVSEPDAIASAGQLD